MLIPRIARAARADALIQTAQLHEPHAALDQAPRDEALPTVAGHLFVRGIESVKLLRRVGLAAEIAQLGHRRLHEIRGLVIFDRRVDRRFARGLRERAVEIADEAEPLALARLALARLDVRQRGIAVGLDDRGLMLRGQITAAEKSHAPVRHRRAARLQHDEAGQVLVLRSETVIHPRARARMAHERKPRVHRVIALRVLVHLRRHRANHRELIRARGEIRKQVGENQPALAVRFRLPRAGHEVAVVVEHRGPHRHGHRLAVTAFQFRLRIPRIHVRHAAAHVGEDDVLHARRKMRPRRAAIVRQRAKTFFREQTGERQRTEAKRSAAEHFAAGEGGRSCSHFGNWRLIKFCSTRRARAPWQG